MCPTLVATVWGVELLGSTWGFFLGAPAIGSLLFGLFYAYEFDSYCLVQPEVFNQSSFFAGSYCLSMSFGVFAGCALLAGIIVVACWKGKWSRVTL
ncbi:unnamed protein product [Ambrosiozyma monospora]|uniref:Unnamed protein product n=1 Tax=Ambrosiozyma monospora TaxID=43982 RepID=A0A9W6Z5V0_AMBMO|nr:unnamed protein product [Ambrosiozyma monospora]